MIGHRATEQLAKRHFLTDAQILSRTGGGLNETANQVHLFASLEGLGFVWHKFHLFRLSLMSRLAQSSPLRRRSESSLSPQLGH